MARRYLRLTPETTWGTFNAVGTPIYVDLDQANSYTVRPKPITKDFRTAGGRNRRVKKIGPKTMLAGNLNMIVHGSQIVALAPLLTATGGSDTVTSFTADYAIVREDGTTQYSRDLGMYVQQAQGTSSEQSPELRLQLQLVGKTTAAITVTDFPEPAATDYASDGLFVHEHLAGALTIATSRTEFESFSWTIKNLFDVRFFESSTPLVIKFVGRDVDWSAKLAYKIATDRSDYEALTNVSASATYTNGAHTLALAFHGQNFYDQVEDDLDDGKVYLQNLSMQSFWDPAAATPSDFDLTAT